MIPKSDGKSAGTPDEQVARAIVGKLLQDGLVDTSQIAVIFDGLATGSLHAAKWTHIAETALELESQRGEGTN